MRTKTENAWKFDGQGPVLFACEKSKKMNGTSMNLILFCFHANKNRHNAREFDGPGPVLSAYEQANENGCKFDGPGPVLSSCEQN